jgi:phage gp29-like protein
MIKPLADLYLQRRWVCRDWSRYNEKHGSPADIAYVPEDADDDAKDAYFSDVVNRGSDTAVMVPRRDGQSKDSGYGLEILEATGRTYESFEKQQGKLDSSVAIIFLGQNLTTEVTPGAGSKAAEKGHQKVADIKSAEDAALADAIRQQVLYYWAAYNHGDPELAPRVRYVTEPPTDNSEEGNGYKAIGEGAQALKTASPRVDVEAILDQHGIPLLTEEEMLAQQQEAQDRALEAQKAMIEAGGGQPPPGGAPGAPPADGGTDPAGGSEADKPEPTAKDGKDAKLKNSGAGVVSRRMFQGFAIAVENPAGSIRSWYDASSREVGRTTMRHDYGFFEDHMGSDGDELDCYVGPDESAREVYVVHQLKKPKLPGGEYGPHDEDKVMLGFPTAASAYAAFCLHRDDGDKAFGRMTIFKLDDFRKTLTRRRGTGKVHARAAEADLVIVKKDDGYHVYSEDRSKHLGGPYATRGEAEKRLEQVDYFKKKKGTASLRAGGHHHVPIRKRRLYSDAVAERGHRSAVRAMSHSLHRVRAAIAGAHSFEDMKKRLVAEFRAMRPDELARVVEKARLMAKAGGMDSAWQQL